MALTPAEAAFVATHEVPVVRAMKPYLDDNREAFLATAPRCTALPVVSGAGTVGAVHSCTTGTWLNAPTFTYQWRRSGAPIAGATASTYTAVTADAGMRLTCVVTGTNVTAAVSVASANGINIPALDNVAPVPVAFSPVDNQIGVAVGVNLVVTFSETVTLGTGIVTLKKVSDNSTITSWNVATQAGTGAGQVNVVGGNQLTLRPAAALADTTDFYVIWDANVVKDAANNPVAATASPSAWNFTTVVSSVVAFSGMLDVLGVPATRAYSTRRLRGGHLGPAIRIRRSNDNAELDIGFVGEGLDTAAISTFVGANSAFVTTWYDQSGTGDNQVQATVANQARIVNAGTLDTRNGKASALFNGATHQYAGAVASGVKTVGAVSALNYPGPTTPAYQTILAQAVTTPVLSTVVNGVSWQLTMGTPSVDGGGNVTVFGGVLFNTRASDPTGIGTTEVLNIGVYQSTGYRWTGWVGEVVWFATQLSAPNYALLFANQATYWGTPAADTVPPTITAFSPLDNATGVAIAANLVATLSEPCTLGASGVITLKKTSDNSTVDSWNVATASGSTAGKVEIVGGTALTMHLTTALANSLGVYVIWDAGVVKDTAGNPIAANAVTTLWNFTTVAASGGTFLLDLYPTASMAYSFRKLRNAYAGSAVRIRRSSDNLELNIGFDGSGNFDTAAAAAHIGGGSGFIVTWFDQSGNAIDVTQATVANQPAYNATGVNAKPAVVYDGVNDNLGCAGVANTSMPAVTTTIMVVMQRTGSVTTNGTVVWANNVTSNVIELFAEYGSGILFDFGTNGARTWPAFPGNWTAMPHLVECGREAVGNFQYVTVDGNELMRQAQTAVLTAGTATFYVGDPATHQSGPISEVVVWAADLAANRAAARGNVQTYWQAGPLLLDGFGMAATKAYSLRKLNSAYAGSAIRIRRSSDNTEQDIGFVGVDLDTAAISTFVGANSAFVVTWYDQSGSGDNATQATVATQARIMNAGVLDTRNGKPSVQFIGTNKYAGTAATTIKAMGAVVAINLPGPNFPGYNCIASVATTGAFIQGNSGTPAYLTTTMGFPIVNGSGSNGVFGGTLQQLDGNGAGYSGAEVTLIGDDRNLNRNWVGWISEVVAFSISLGSGSRATLRADQKAYWGTPPYPLLLDHLGVSATRAYSTRKLRSAYAGSAIRIRRSSDNAEQDIGFVGENLDTAAISTFVGANSAFVVKWYDQSGSALDATQPTVVNQPRIVNAGTLDVRNTKASVYYDGANHWLRTVTTNPWTAQTIGAIAAIDSPSPFPHGVGLVTGNGSFPIMGQAAATNYYNAGQLGPINIDNVATAVPPWSGVLHNVRVSSATGFSTTEYTYIGADRSPSSLWVGWIGEVVSFPVQLSTPNYATLYDNQKTYWGTP